MMLYSRHLPLNVPLAGNPTDACAQTPAVFIPFSSGDPLEAPDERDLDWEDYHAGACWWWWEASWESLGSCTGAGIPDFNTKELEALLHYLPTQNDANQAQQLQSWQWQRQWRWATCYSLGRHLYHLLYSVNTCYIAYIRFCMLYTMQYSKFSIHWVGLKVWHSLLNNMLYCIACYIACIACYSAYIPCSMIYTMLYSTFAKLYWGGLMVGYSMLNNIMYSIACYIAYTACYIAYILYHMLYTMLYSTFAKFHWGGLKVWYRCGVI